MSTCRTRPGVAQRAIFLCTLQDVRLGLSYLMLMEKVYQSPIKITFITVFFTKVAVASFSSASLSAVMVSEDNRSRFRLVRLLLRRFRVNPVSSSSSSLRPESVSESERKDISRSSELGGPPVSDPSCILPSLSDCDPRRPLPLAAG